ncbi:unnamed protein product, partial [Larinioides sclopetarius]
AGSPETSPRCGRRKVFSSAGFLNGLRRRSKGRSLFWSAGEISGEDLVAIFAADAMPRMGTREAEEYSKIQ